MAELRDGAKERDLQQIIHTAEHYAHWIEENSQHYNNNSKSWRRAKWTRWTPGISVCLFIEFFVQILLHCGVWRHSSCWVFSCVSTTRRNFNNLLLRLTFYFCRYLLSIIYGHLNVTLATFSLHSGNGCVFVQRIERRWSKLGQWRLYTSLPTFRIQMEVIRRANMMNWRNKTSQRGISYQIKVISLYLHQSPLECAQREQFLSPVSLLLCLGEFRKLFAHNKVANRNLFIWKDRCLLANKSQQ